MPVRSRVCDAGHLEDGRSNVHDSGKLVSDGGRPPRKAGDARHSYASLGRVKLVQSGRCCCGLCPSGAVPDEAVGGADVVQGIVIVLANVLQQRSLDQRIRLIGSPLGPVVAHEHDHGIVKLANFLEVVDDTADVGVDALLGGGGLPKEVRKQGQRGPWCSWQGFYSPRPCRHTPP